jgi:hypothetical protein
MHSLVLLPACGGTRRLRSSEIRVHGKLRHTLVLEDED